MKVIKHSWLLYALNNIGFEMNGKLYSTNFVQNQAITTARNQEITTFMHCNKNSKHILPEMKLRGLITNFYIHVSRSDLYIPTISLIWNLYFPILGERTLGSTAEVERRAGNCRQAGVGGSSLASPPLLSVEPRVHINDQHTNFPMGKLWIVNGNY
jgi:hypothetical protein